MTGVVAASGREAGVAAVLDRMERAERVILTTHLNADGDGTGSQAALLELLADMGKEGWIVNPTPFPDLFRFLISDSSRILDAREEEAAQRCREADLVVIVDTGERSRIGRVWPMVEHLPTLVIDHHPTSEDSIEGLALRDSSAAAAGELVFDLLRERGGPWTPAVLDGLYVAILTDTGSFRFSNATPSVHRMAAELIERGASPEELYRRVYGEVPLRRIRILERTLPSLALSPSGAVAWLVVPSEPFRELGCTSEDLDRLIDIPRELAGVEVGILFREVEPGSIKVSLRSKSWVDVNALAREFGGGGHVRAAGALLKESLAGAIERVTQRVELVARGGAAGATGAAPRGGEL